MRIDSVITLRTEELARRQWTELFERLTFVDADQNEIQAFDHRSGAGVVVVPRGALDLIPKTKERSDLRCRPAMPKLAYTKNLDTHGFTGQKAAVRAMQKYEQGQVRLSTGSGKTSIGLAFVAGCGTRTLVLVHTQALLEQWVNRAKEEIPGIDVGIIQGDRSHVGHLTVATMQTMRDKYLRLGGKFWRKFGCVMIDESHHAANMSYEWLLNVCPAYYRFGLSASDKRSDGRQRLVRYNVGPVIYRAPFKSQVPIEVQPVFTNFRSRFNATRWTKLVAELVNDEERNRLVAEITEGQIAQGHSVLLLSRQIKHLELIAEQLSDKMDGHFAIVTGHIPGKQREQMIQALRDGELLCILGTQLFEEGVDVPRLDRLVLAFPGTDVTALQKVGRTSRSFKGKILSVVIDIVDPHVAVLARQYTQRKAWYKSVKIPVRKPIDERKVRKVGIPEKKKGRKLLRDLRVRRSRGSRAA